MKTPINYITLENFTHAYTERKLFDQTSFYLSEGEKVGIIGINGTGKSTLLKILAGKEEPDEGDLTMGRNLRIAYLPQKPEFLPEETALAAALPRKEDISTPPESYEAEAKSYLSRLGFTRFHQPVTELSGGQKKRIALVRTLLTPCDVFILDEPTNHLDSAMSAWLENYLKNTRTALIMITHDRYFLDSVVNRIVEIDKGKIYSYNCNYIEYLERKSQREEIALATERKRQSVLRKEIAWMKRGARARSTKQKAHIARYEKLRDMEAPELDQQIEISSGSSRLGKTTVELEHLSKSYGEHRLFQDFSYIFLHRDRIGIIGPNGCGKSTLMKIIMGLEPPDSGTVTIGQTVKIGYFSQENESMDDSLRIIDYVREGGNVIHTPEGEVTASLLLERFLFPGSKQYTRIEKLSGGEKRRLYLLRILMEAPNVLFLDEPTNDLDITTLTLLEDYLDSFDGIVVAVSHDRYFLDRIATRIFAFQEDGSLRQYEGGYTDYLNASALSPEETLSTEKNENLSSTEASLKKTVNRNNWKNGQKKKLKMTFAEQRDYEHIEEEIASLEEHIAQLEEEMLSSARDFVKLNEITEKKENLEAELAEKMDRWMYLEDLAERIRQEI